MGNSWLRRHRHEMESATRIPYERKRYETWKAQFTTRGKWDDKKVKEWMKARSERIDIGGEEE